MKDAVLEQVMTKQKETKGTVLYATTEPSPIESVYIRKTMFPDGKYPESINLFVTVTK